MYWNNVLIEKKKEKNHRISEKEGHAFVYEKNAWFHVSFLIYPSQKLFEFESWSPMDACIFCFHMDSLWLHRTLKGTWIKTHF